MSSSRVHSESLRAARMRAGLTQDQLARLVSVSRQTVAALEAGSRGTYPDVIESLAQALNVPAASLVDSEPESFLKVADVAKRLNVSHDTVRRRIADGTFDATRIGGVVRVSARSVTAALTAARTTRAEAVA